MQIKYFYYIPSSMGLINENLYKSCEGALFDKDDRVDLRIYLEEFDSITIATQDTLLVYSVALNITSQPINYDTLKEVNFAYKVGAHIRNIAYINDRYVVFYERKTIKEQAYIVVDRIDGCQVRLEGLGGKLLIDDQRVLIRRPDRVICFDWNAKELWQYEVGKNMDGVYEQLTEYKGDVIFNAGNYGDGQSHLVCLKKSNGQVVWKKYFDRLIDNALVIGNRIYVAQKNYMSVLSTDGAEMELSFTVGLPDTETATTLWTDGKLLYVLASMSNKLLCHAVNDGAHIKTYMLPSYPDLKHGSLPSMFQNTNYLGLKPALGVLAGVEGGLLSWTPEDVLAGKELELEEKPFIISMVIKEDDGSQSYYMNIPCNNIHDVLRFGEIEARKISALHGKQMWDNEETRNKKFNGQIKLIIDPAVGEENRVYLDMLAKRCTFFAKVMDIKSGNGKKPIEVSWAFSNA